MASYSTKKNGAIIRAAEQENSFIFEVPYERAVFKFEPLILSLIPFKINDNDLRMSTTNLSNFNLSFDIGYSSIGWSISSKPANAVFPNWLGAGVVVFDDDSCMAKSRAEFRRMRRNIASKRNRIKRMREVLSGLGVMGKDELDNAKTEHPWFLAAETLASGKILSWSELWSVLRYYAHNRGYDGNSMWAKFGDDSDGDSEREANAEKLMADLGTSTQAETICAYLGVDAKSPKPLRFKKYFKGQNLAFPREIVFKEVERIIDAHIGILPKCDENFKKLMIGNWREVPSNIKLPGRFTSDRGLLFGQYMPRFSNRIKTKCPLSGEKTPNCHSREFLDFRWKSLLANMAFPDGTDLMETRRKIDDFMLLYGALSKNALKKILKEVIGELPSNYNGMFLASEMEKALEVDPVRALILRTVYPNISFSLPNAELVEKLWKLIPKFVFTRMFRLKEYSFADICALLSPEKSAELAEFVRVIFDSSPASKKSPKPDFETAFNFKMRVQKISGRSPYSRQLMKSASEEIMRGVDPRSEGGSLYPRSESTKKEVLSNIDTWTNNHLVRHRLKIFKRLYMDIVREYCGADKSLVKSVAIEVVKDITAFSGLDSKKKAAKLNDLVAHHKSVSAYLKKEYPELSPNGSILRKARIADDLGWVCPYTGCHFSPRQLFESGNMEREHIIPRSLRPSDSLESLVITWKEVNDMKGQRTAYEFIKECQGMKVPGRQNLSIVTPERFEAFVRRLKKPMHPAGKADIERIKIRNKLLLTEHYKKREGGFLPSDLTQTSHLNKLAFKVVKSLYADAEKAPELIHVPGTVTSVVRKNWDLLPCMGDACPEIYETLENGDKVLRLKDEIRSITHLHHAVDAVAMGLAASVFPRTRNFYEAVSKRRLNQADRQELLKTGLVLFSGDKWKLVELEKSYLKEISGRISENRVVKFLPRKMSGMDVEQTLWGVVKENENGTVTIRQYGAGKGESRRSIKKVYEPKLKLLGYESKNTAKSKLARNKAVIIIKGNFGVALANPPQIIPHHNVWQRLSELAEKNGGRFPKILRRNQIIEIPSGRYKGIWRITSIKNNSNYIGVDMIHPIYARIKEKSKINVNLNTIIKDGMKIIDTRLIGA